MKMRNIIFFSPPGGAQSSSSCVVCIINTQNYTEIYQINLNCKHDANPILYLLDLCSR